MCLSMQSASLNPKDKITIKLIIYVMCSLNNIIKIQYNPSREIRLEGATSKYFFETCSLGLVLNIIIIFQFPKR